MWNRKDVMDVHRQFNDASSTAAGRLLREYPDGNNIANEGCLITCLAMVLRLLAARGTRWTPASLNKEAKRRLYYSKCGLSIVPVYADLIADVTYGEVQLCTQEQYFSGELGWPATFASDCDIVRGYRALGPPARRDFSVILKIGTHDDTLGSHYVLVDPEEPGAAGENDVPLLDPVQPPGIRTNPWKLSDSSKWLLTDDAIAREWKRAKLRPLQISGAWAFARWRSRSQRGLGTILFQAMLQHSAAASPATGKTMGMAAGSR